MKNKIPSLLILLGFVVLLFRNWFFPGLIVSGDFGYLFDEAIAKISLYPYLWDASFGKGLGGNSSFILGLNTFYYSSAYVLKTFLHLNWSVIERVVWFWPFLAVSVFSSVYLCRKIFRDNPFWIAGPFIFVCNTHVLMLVGGGQIGVAMGYALAPLVIGLFLDMRAGRKQERPFTLEVSTGVALALQVMFDPRIAYVTMFGVGVYLTMRAFTGSGIGILKRMIIPVGTAIMLHCYWLLPLLIAGSNPIAAMGPAYSSPDAVTYFSFADFSHSFSLLHPNWPDNIFGKIRFLQPEFIGIPLLAFTSLMFIGSRIFDNKQKISTFLFFALLGITGAFFAKGANPPFGEVYIWLFSHVPGFIMFRDPSKFYPLIVLSYMVLIPAALDCISSWLYASAKKYGRGRIAMSVISLICGAGFLVFWGIAHREAFTGHIGGTFIHRSVPLEYIRLKDYFSSYQAFSRVLWVPSRQAYGFHSVDKPAVSIETFGVASASAFVSWIQDAHADDVLRRHGVSHIVVPTDPFGELFVTDRKPDDYKRAAVIASLRAKETLTELMGFGHIAVFEVKRSYGHVFFADAPETELPVRRISPTHYEADLPSFQDSRLLIFSESYDPYWELTIDGESVYPGKTSDGLQAYVIERTNGGVVSIRYRLQMWLHYGLAVSLGTLVFIIGHYVYGTILPWVRKRLW